MEKINCEKTTVVKTTVVKTTVVKSIDAREIVHGFGKIALVFAEFSVDLDHSTNAILGNSSLIRRR